MKVTFYTNATCVYESNGFRLLSDPWLTEPIMDGSWFHDPPIKTTPQDVLDVDALYISHIHPDHCDEGTLRHFRRDIPIITLRDKYEFCAKHLRKMGFTHVTALGSGFSWDAWGGPLRLTMFGPFTKHPYHDCELGNVVDSALLVSDGRHSVLNTNDNTPSVEAAERLRRDYGVVDLAQLNWNAAGPYPCCFENLTLEEKHAESKRIVHRQLDHMADVAKALGAKRVQPFAGAFRLGGSPEKEAMNAYNGTCSPEVAAAWLDSRDIPPLLLGEGEGVDLGTL